MPVELWVIPVTEHRGKTHLAVEQSNSNSLHIINTSISQSPAPSEAPTFTFWFRSSAGAEDGVISKKRLTLWPLALLPLLCCHLVLLAQSYPGDEGQFDPPAWWKLREAYRDATEHQRQFAAAVSNKSEALVLIYGPLMACQYMDPHSSL